MLINSNEIEIKIEEIIHSFIYAEEYDEKELLHIILSNSQQAINLVALIEDEFDIEFDDDEINIDFFQSIKKIKELVHQHLFNK